MLRCRDTKVLLLSVFLFGGVSACSHAVPALAMAWRACGVITGRGKGVAARRRCENFSPGLLTVKKSVIRFRLSRPCLRTE
jgi:hypothetical protein